MATREKKVRMPGLRPPVEIQEKTKERRAWLAQELEKVNATPGLTGKIVGLGSYQSISVWKITEVPGRVQYRGTCQGCGNSVAIPDVGHKVTSLHGYERPGDGYAHGKCIGAQKLCANVSITLTQRVLVDLAAQVIAMQKEHDELKAAYDAIDIDSAMWRDERREEAERLMKLRNKTEHDRWKVESSIRTTKQWIGWLERSAIPALGTPLAEIVL